jgi:hypothetical protein
MSLPIHPSIHPSTHQPVNASYLHARRGHCKRRRKAGKLDSWLWRLIQTIETGRAWAVAASNERYKEQQRSEGEMLVNEIPSNLRLGSLPPAFKQIQRGILAMVGCSAGKAIFERRNRQVVVAVWRYGGGDSLASVARCAMSSLGFTCSIRM